MFSLTILTLRHSYSTYVLGTTLIVGGLVRGMEENRKTSTVLSFDPSPSSNAISMWGCVELLESRCRHVTGAHGQSIIVAGGEIKSGETTSSVEIFHRSNGKFTPGPNMWQKRLRAAAAVMGWCHPSLFHILYVFLGVQFLSCSKTCENHDS